MRKITGDRAIFVPTQDLVPARVLISPFCAWLDLLPSAWMKKVTQNRGSEHQGLRHCARSWRKAPRNKSWPRVRWAVRIGLEIAAINHPENVVA